MTGLNLLEEISARVPDTPAMKLLDAVNAVVDILERRLLLFRSELLYDSATLVTDSSGIATLPAQFLGLFDRPIVGLRKLEPYQGRPIIPIVYAGTLPVWYRVKGSVLEVGPTATSQQVTLSYYKGLGRLAAVSEALPLADLFRQVYVLGAVALLGGAWPAVDPGFEVMLQQYVDVALSTRNRIIAKSARVAGYF